MKNDYFKSIVIIVLSVSIFCGSWLISNSINNLANSNDRKSNIAEKTQLLEPQLLDEKGLMAYLGITDEEFDAIKVNQREKNLDTLPYIEIYGKYYYPRKAINKWLTDVIRIEISK